VPTSSALAQARERLGSEPLRELFERAAGPCAQRPTAGAWLHAPEALQDCPPGALAEVTGEAVLTSALACQLTGADPPAKAELSWLRPGRSGRRGS
jgi:hypothetical protein